MNVFFLLYLSMRVTVRLISRVARTRKNTLPVTVIHTILLTWLSVETARGGE